VFPLRGKLLNVRDASMKQLKQNAELGALCAIMGLDFSKKYEKGVADGQLRYGKILIMADQDHDGSHIKGLIINLFAHFWPQLLKSEQAEFIGQFATPIIKAKHKRAGTLSFASVQEYLHWRGGLEEGQLRSWSIKYYKGLGTVLGFEHKNALEDAIGSHACSLQASTHVTNIIPLGCSLNYQLAL
jgi:DNA topoisomerase-2